MRCLFFTEPTEAECFEAEQELLFDVHFRQLDREIRKMSDSERKTVTDEPVAVMNEKTLLGVDCNGTEIYGQLDKISVHTNNHLENQHWCMCVKLKDVARDGKSTCSICGGRDAYGLSTERPEDKKKITKE